MQAKLPSMMQKRALDTSAFFNCLGIAFGAGVGNGRKQHRGKRVRDRCRKKQKWDHDTGDDTVHFHACIGVSCNTGKETSKYD